MIFRPFVLLYSSRGHKGFRGRGKCQQVVDGDKRAGRFNRHGGRGGGGRVRVRSSWTWRRGITVVSTHDPIHEIKVSNVCMIKVTYQWTLTLAIDGEVRKTGLAK